MANSSSETKKNIAKLVEKYERIKAEGKIGKYNEAQTRAEFIEPLFEFLGWDMKNWDNPNEVTTEESVSNGRVDLAFRLNGIPKFFLEAKSLKTDLDIESYSRQAINYSWNKGVSWAVLTDFESLKLYNAQAKSKNLQDKLVFEITYEEYISDFERLQLLSKESFSNNELDKYAEKYGKKIKKQTVTEKLYEDLRKAREILTKSFGIWNKDLSQENLDEGVQRILDRLIFIRVLEDKELEEPTLKPLINAWQKDGSIQLFEKLTKKFRELDSIYNSNLFSEHPCEKWEEYGKGMEEVVAMLYGTDMYEYDFKHIPADILGGVYESYLGYISQNPIEIETDKKSGKMLKFEDKKELKLKSRKKRKEQGIYYTPKYIVDYIVKETLGKKLEEVKSIHGLKQLKILDPACGSGSFLTKALETINDKYKEFGNPGNQDTKTQILIENIHGVDLDQQAVELAKLNLLIDALEKKDKLPNLTENIRVGNSLISGSEEELKKYFGKNWRDKKPFDWDEEFSGAAKQGGFDVIIGNPPYVRNRDLADKDKIFFGEKYFSAKGQYDIY
jgi:predicted type IV restriction endonuclease